MSKVLQILFSKFEAALTDVNLKIERQNEMMTAKTARLLEALGAKGKRELYDICNEITGRAVAQHCYNGDVSFYGKNGNLTSCKIETLEQIDTQFVSIDYVHEMNVCSKFGKNPFTGDFWAKG